MYTSIPALSSRTLPKKIQDPVYGLNGILLSVGLCLCLSGQTYAEAKPQRLVKEAAREFLENKAIASVKAFDANHYKVITKPLDKNIRLVPCNTPIQIEDISQAKYGSQLLKAHCRDHWNILVTGMTHIYASVLVSSRKLVKRDKISESDIRWQEADISQLPNGFLSRPEDAIGKYPNTIIQAGTPINCKQLTDSRTTTSDSP